MAFILKIFNPKEGSTSNDAKTVLRDKFKELPAVAHKAFKSSGLTAQEVIKEWDLFVYCLYTNCKGLSLKMVNGNLTLSEKELLQQTESKRTKSSERSDVTEMDTLTKEPLLSDEQTKKNEDETENHVIHSDPKEFYSNWRQIGDGAFGTVQSAQDIATGRTVAVKTVRRSFAEHKERILNEIYILRTCNHPNIVGYVRSFLYRDHVSIVTEYCDAGSIRGLVALGIKEDMIAYIIYNVLQGLVYMHNHNRIHRDIKSSNVLITTSGDIKICDMGLSTDSKNTGMAGSKFWCAPEMIKKQKYDNKVDIWSLGALTFELAERRPPYREFRSLKALFYTVTVGAPPLSKPRKFSPQFKDFLNLCFKQDPVARPSAEMLLQHELFKRVMTKEIFSRHLRFLLVSQTFSGI